MSATIRLIAYPFLSCILIVQLVLLGLAGPVAAQDAGPKLDEVPVDSRPTADEEAEALPLLREDDRLLPFILPSINNLSNADVLREAEEYRDCMRLSLKNPQAALDKVRERLSRSASLPARHCRAAALIELERYEDAAQEFSEIADDFRTGKGLTFNPADAENPYSLISGVYAQMGNALMMADRVEQAYTAFSQAIADAPLEQTGFTAVLYVDRARALGSLGDYEAAIDDLEKALSLNGWTADIGLYLATARRALGQLDAAHDAIENAYERRDDDPAIFLERGNIQLLLGNRDNARMNWQTVLDHWPQSTAAYAARANLANLEKAGEKTADQPS